MAKPPNSSEGKSSIPDGAAEVFVEVESSGHRLFKCVMNGEEVGCRRRGDHGELFEEHGLKDGRYHGYWRQWGPDGKLEFETLYVNGLEHGTARQWDNGKLVCSYEMDYGTGVDLYGGVRALSEERHMNDGFRHGFERWWDDNNTVWQESHFKRGKEHGVFRHWNHRGGPRRGYPQYFVDGSRVTKRQYLRAAALDPSLPPYREEDNNPERELPPEYLSQRKISRRKKQGPP